MSRTWETKARILESLKKKSRTLTDLSQELGLAPSTVSQHLHELLESGRIVESNLSTSKKWKYYSINMAMVETKKQEQQRSGMPDNRLIWAALVSLTVVGLLVFTVFWHPAHTSPVSGTSSISAFSSPSNLTPISNGTTVFSVSDDPQSYNITDVYVSINSISVTSASSGNVYVLPLTTDRADLVALDNISQEIANVVLPAGEYGNVTLRLSNVSARINGMNQSVLLPGYIISLNTTFNVSNATTNWVNLDVNLEKSLHITGTGAVVMLPSITATYSSNATIAVTNRNIISVQHQGRIGATSHFDMNLNGYMVRNLTEYENATIGINTTTGSLLANETFPRGNMVSRYRNNLLIVTNFTGNVGAGNPIVGTGRATGAGNYTGGVGGTVGTAVSGGGAAGIGGIGGGGGGISIGSGASGGANTGGGSGGNGGNVGSGGGGIGGTGIGGGGIGSSVASAVSGVSGIVGTQT